MSEFQIWCETVTDCVRFKPDRYSIAEELKAHYEDHIKDLERIGYDTALAEERALLAMGDPEEIGRAMDRAHKPWLGWLWMVSRWLVLAVFLLVLYTLFCNGLPEWGASNGLDQDGWQSVAHEVVVSPRALPMGSYELTIDDVQCIRYPELEGQYDLRLTITVETAKFWLDDPQFDECLSAIDSNGVPYHHHWKPFIHGSVSYGGDSGWIWLEQIENAPEWIEITHKTAGWTIRLDLPREEEWP